MFSVSSPYPIFIDLSGSPLDNGLAYFGTANQNPETNPITVYWDEAGLIPAAQPIPIFNGVPTRNGSAANVFVTSDYSVTVRDASSRIVLAQQSSAVQGNELASDLASTASGKGAALVANTRRVHNVKSYGAACDSVTDDTSFIQTALNAAAADGRPLYIPGKSLISADLTVTNANITIFGDGQEQSQLLVSHAGRGIVYSSDTRTRAIEIYGLSVVATNAAATIGIDISFPLTSSIDQLQVMIDDVSVTKSGVGKWLTGGIRCNNVTNPLFSRVMIEGDFADTDYGISLEGQCLDASFSQVRAYLVQNAVQMSGTSEGATFDDFTAVTVDRGIFASSAGYEPWLALNNFHINARTACVETSNRAQITITNGLLYANSAVSSPGWSGIKIAAINPVTANYISISNVVFNKAAYTGVAIGLDLTRVQAAGAVNCVFIGLDTGIKLDSATTDFKPFGNQYPSCTTEIDFNGTAGHDPFQITANTAARNYILSRGATAGGSPSLSALGDDTNIGLDIAAKGSGTVSLVGNGFAGFQMFAPASAVNRLRVRADTAGNSPQLIAEGSDTNINLRLTTKGTGRVQFGTHAATGDAPITGYVEIVDAGGAIRKLAVIT